MVRVPCTSRTPTPRCCLHLTPISRPSRSLLLVAKGWCITRGSLERKEIAIAAVSVAALYAAVSVQLSLGSVISLVPMVSYLKLPEATALPGHTPRGAIVHSTRLGPAGADVSIDACEHFPLHRRESARAQGAGPNPQEQVGPDPPPEVTSTMCTAHRCSRSARSASTRAPRPSTRSTSCSEGERSNLYASVACELSARALGVGSRC